MPSIMKKILVIGSVISVVVIVGWLIKNQSASVTVYDGVINKTIKSVQASRVGDIVQDGRSTLAYGQVVSAQGVDVVPEISGIINRVYKKLGDSVSPGTVIVELQNATQQQSVYQAQASLSSVQANLQRVKKGADHSAITNLENALSISETNLIQATNARANGLSSIVFVVGESIQTNIDSMFFRNGTKDSAELIILADPISTKYPLEASRKVLQNMYHSVSGQPVDSTTVIDAVSDLVDQYGSLTDDLIQHVTRLPDSKLSQTQKDEYLTVLRGIAQVIDGHKSTVSSLNTAVNNASQAVATAKNNLDDALAGPESEDLAIAVAGVNQAQANLTSAQLLLGKTRITSPVYGKISSIQATVGQLVGPSGVLFSVANNNTLRVDTSVSVSDASQIQIGDAVLVENMYQGYVSQMSPSVDIRTGKVALQILLRNQDVNLIAGSGVGVTFISNEDNQSAQDITMPIEAVFVRDDQPYVYVVRDGVAVPQAIVAQELFGAFIGVTGGLSLDDVVVLYARGIKDNQQVRINK